MPQQTTQIGNYVIDFYKTTSYLEMRDITVGSASMIHFYEVHHEQVQEFIRQRNLNKQTTTYAQPINLN